MPSFSERTLVLAIGNASRGDDGLGWAFADAVEASGFPGTIAQRYQLQIEDAELCSHYEQVVFVDAWKTAQTTLWEWMPCTPSREAAFTTHALSPQAVLYLCESVFDCRPEAWLLLLRGTQWELGQPLSATAQDALAQGVKSFCASTNQSLR